MNWQDWGAFWAMGGYGLYVWGSVSVVALGIALELATEAARRKALLRALKRGQA